MGIRIIGYKEPEGLRVAYTNPGPHQSPTVQMGEIKYHYSNKGREFDFSRYFIPGQVMGERVVDGNLRWRRFGDVTELRAHLGNEDFMEVSWYYGHLHKGVLHRNGKKEAVFDSMLGMYGLDYENFKTGHTYHDPEYSDSESTIGRGKATQEIYQLFMAPYAERIAEYTRVLDTQAPIKWRKRKGEWWLSPVLPLLSGAAIRKRLARDK